MIYLKYATVVILLILAAFVVFRIIVKRDYKTIGKLKPITTFYQILVFFVHAFSSYLFIDPKKYQISKGNFLEIIGIIFMIIGGVFLLIGMINLGIKKSFGIETTGLQRAGFYRFSRNPQIVFYIIFLMGYVLIYPGWAGLIWLAILFVICHMMIISEEEHLLKIFKDDYVKYCENTPRYIGRKSRLY